MTAALRPLWIGVPCDTGCADAVAIHTVGDMYLPAITHFPGAPPVLVLAMMGSEATSHYLSHYPSHYSCMPLLAICRGCQELNVALGGTLEAEIHEPAGSAPDVGTGRAFVNSLHRQSVLDLGQCVSV